MKRIFSALIFLVVLSVLSSCNKSTLPPYGEDFRKANAVLFPNTDCQHVVVYQKVSDPLEQAIYHITKCKYGNCNFVSEVKPHTISMNRSTVHGSTRYKENGYLYHEYGEICRECGERFTVCVLCQTQDPECGRITRADGTTVSTSAHCMTGVDFQELFNETPYHIVSE